MLALPLSAGVNLKQILRHISSSNLSRARGKFLPLGEISGGITSPSAGGTFRHHRHRLYLARFVTMASVATIANTSCKRIGNLSMVGIELSSTGTMITRRKKKMGLEVE